MAVFNRFPDITNPIFRDRPVRHSVTQHIATRDPLPKCRVRLLSPNRYQQAKDKFEQMPDLGIIRKSSSNWSSALHMLPKKVPGDRWPCGDYRVLNVMTLPDNYPIPNLHDFSSNLRNKRIFSKNFLEPLKLV